MKDKPPADQDMQVGKPHENTVDALYQAISEIVEDARKTVYRATNQAMVKAYWEIGRMIVEEEQAGKRRAEYGKALIAGISTRLLQNFGRGFSERNLEQMRRFFLEFENLQAVSANSKIPQTLPAELSWSHYCLLMRIKNKNAREFYVIESAKNNWSVRELDRQISSLLFERLALSKDKEKVLELSSQGQIVTSPKDLIKDPYVLEFLGMSERADFHEKDLEQNLIDRLQAFLLELGRGFALVARQKRITVGGDHYYIGLILCSHKNEAMVRYTLLDDREQIFASKYRLCLPTEDELKREISEERARLELVMREET